jgi:hypothetical protein
MAYTGEDQTGLHWMVLRTDRSPAEQMAVALVHLFSLLGTGARPLCPMWDGYHVEIPRSLRAPLQAPSQLSLPQLTLFSTVLFKISQK